MLPRASPVLPAAWLLLAGSVVLVDPSGLLPGTTLRWAVVATAVLVLAAAGHQRPQVPPVVAAAVVALLVLVAASAVVGVDPWRAWIGHPRRNLGVLTWVVFVAAGLLGARAGTERDRPGLVLGVARAATCGAVLIGATVVAELVGHVPTGLGFAGARAGGWYGQPITLAAAAALLGLCAAGTAVDRRHSPAWRCTAAAGAAGCAAATVASQTRGAWLGLAVAVVVLAPSLRALGRTLPPALRRRPGLVTVLAVGVGVLAVAASPLGARVTSAFDDDETGRGRIDEWRIAADVVVDRPLLGVGPEGYRIVAPGAIDADYAARHGREAVVDRAHGGPLDVAVASGVPAGVLHAGLLLAAGRAAWRVNRRSPGTFEAYAGAGVTAYAVGQLSSFPTAEVDPMAWFLAGLVIALEWSGRGRWAAPRLHDRPTVSIAVRLACAAGAAAMLWAGPTAVAVDRALGDAVRSAAAGDPEAALAHADRATARRPDQPDAWFVAARLAAAGPSLLDLDAGIRRVEIGRRHVPGDPALEQLHAELLAERAIRSGLAQDRIAASGALRDRLADDPTHPLLAQLLAEVAAGAPAADR